jgi:hypothetical protein
MHNLFAAENARLLEHKDCRTEKTKSNDDKITEIKYAERCRVEVWVSGLKKTPLKFSGLTGRNLL